MPAELPSRVVAGISFVGRGGGVVKALPGFRKGHHTVPDQASATANAFLGRICETELADEAERLFQEVRVALGYKRRDLSLTVASPAATLVAKDFTVDWLYALEERDPGRFSIMTTLHQLRVPALARNDAFSRIFAGRFSEISFALRKPARVEAVIDAIEALEGENALAVRYPSDCRQCIISVDGIDAEVRVNGAALEVVFRRAGGPAELIDAFANVREAFQIAKPLAGLID